MSALEQLFQQLGVVDTVYGAVFAPTAPTALATTATPERPPMSASVQTPVTAQDWAKAEALAIEYVKRESNALDPISFRRFEYAPFLLGSWWTGGEAYVLVYGGQVHAERGVAALPGYFASLGAARLRVLTPDQLDRMLGILGADTPEVMPGAQWRNHFPYYEDLYPAVVENDGVIKYVIHYVQGAPAPLPRGGGPAPGGPPPGGRPPGPSPGGGRVIGGPLRLQHWSLQLSPPDPNVRWMHEESFERPDPKNQTQPR